MRVFAIVFCAMMAVVFAIAAAGVVRFNFTNDDIYVRGENGEIVRYDDLR